VRPWEDRPVEIAHLLNPAFCSEVLRRAIRLYNKNAARWFPYPLTFLVLPILLHHRTREAIAPNTREQLHVWLQAHQDVRIGFAERARQLVPHTIETLSFLLQVNAITVDATAGLTVVRRRQRHVDGQGEGEIADCYRKAEIVGRWFARAGSPANIYTMWGVKP
jgi:ABC-three component (ABC-3C) system Middle Component 3